ncbi:hypothetical protein [Achromobacter sp. KK8]
MKLLGVAVALLVCWALHKWAPDIAMDVASGRLPTAALAAIAGALTLLWATAYSRLSSFEKLDDLRQSQRDLVLTRVSGFKKLVIRSITWNALLAAAALAANEFVKLPSGAKHSGEWLAYLIFAACGFWLGGLIQSKLLLGNIEASRDAMHHAQAAERARARYLQQLRSDAKAKPLDHQDKHLAGYST